MLRPWKCSFSACATWFHWPPSPAVGLQPGFTLPPHVSSGPLTPDSSLSTGSNLAPPAVSQQPSSQIGPETTKLRTIRLSESVVQKSYEPDDGVTIVLPSGSCRVSLK